MVRRVLYTLEEWLPSLVMVTFAFLIGLQAGRVMTFAQLEQLIDKVKHEHTTEEGGQTLHQQQVEREFVRILRYVQEQEHLRKNGSAEYPEEETTIEREARLQE